MTWEEIMRRVLPPVGGLSPQVTKPGAFGAGVEQGRHPPSTIPHKGIDFNYPVGQTGINKNYPALHSPVAGVVLNAGEGNVGRIAIRDANGFVHEILHTHTQNARKGDLVEVGAPIGTMGNTGVSRDPKKEGDYHLHYQLKDRSGNVVNPTTYWNHPFLEESRRAAEILSGQDEKSPQNGTPPPGRPGQPFFNPLNQIAPAAVVQPSDPTYPNPIADRFGVWGSVPRPNAPATSTDPANFADRFGNWASVAGGVLGNVAPSNATPLKPGPRSEIPDGVTPTGDDAPADIPVRRLVSSPAVSAPSLAPASPLPLLGIFSGKPMRDYPVPPPIFQSRDPSPPEDNELFQRWMRWLDA
jgi:hypothetical protein